MNLVRIPRKMENPKEPYVRQFDDTGKYLYIERLAYLKYEKNYTGMIRVPFTIAQFPDILKDYDILGNRKVHIAGKEKYTGFLIRRKNNGK